MPYNSSGVFSIVNTFIPGTTILSSTVNGNFSDIATGLSTAVLKNGTQTVTADIPMSGFGFTAVGKLSSATEITLASATTTNVLGAASLFVAISGTTTITSLGTGTNTLKFVRFTGALTLTHNATTLILPGGANITTAAGDTMVVISDASSNARIYSYQVASTSPTAVNKGYLYGLTLSNDVSDATNDIDIAAGVATDDGNAVVMALGSAYVKQLDTAWAVGTNQGMRDTGSIANGFWYIYLIRRPDTGVVDVLASVSATAPTMPADYTQKRRIGAIYRTSGALRAFVQTGDQFLFKVPFSDYNATNPGNSAVLPDLTIPIAAGITASFRVKIGDDTPAANTYVLITSPSQTDTTPTSSLSHLRTLNVAVANQDSGQFLVSTTTGAIRYRVDASTADFSIGILTNGWYDDRGQSG